MLYSKNGSIPKPETDGTDGWIEVPDAPQCPEGKNLVWLNWEWIIRDPKPADRAGYQWNWQHDTRSWVEGAWPQAVVEQVVTVETVVSLATVASLTTDQVASLTTDQIGVIE
jgi:hypothetical protein